MAREHHVKNSWLNIAAGLALLSGQSLFAQNEAPAAPAADPTPAVQPQGLKPIPDVMESSALGFRRVNEARSFENAERTTVRLVRNGRIVQARRVGVGGVAQISEVTPGAYSVFATGSEGFAAFGVYLGDGAFSASSSVGLVPRQDMGPVLEAIQNFTRNSSPTPADAANAGGANVAKDLDRVTEHGDFELHADGSVKGQVVKAGPRSEPKQALPGMQVSFIRDGVVVANGTTDQDGQFSIPGIEPGIYSFVVAGSEGFAALAVGAVRPVEQAQARTRRFEFVAAAVQTPVVTVGTVPPGDFALLNSLANANANPANQNAAPMAVNGAPGGGGAGGAGGGAAGGGGFGGLLGAAAAVGAGFAIAEAIDDDPSTP